MKLINKRSPCEGCKAFIEGMRGSAGQCGLSVKTKIKTHAVMGVGLTFLYPDEPCYNPKTFKQYIEVRKILFP